jgi:hypothetical protein
VNGHRQVCARSTGAAHGRWLGAELRSKRPSRAVFLRAQVEQTLHEHLAHVRERLRVYDEDILDLHVTRGTAD